MPKKCLHPVINSDLVFTFPKNISKPSYFLAAISNIYANNKQNAG
jgi:hypothetical protein